MEDDAHENTYFASYAMNRECFLPRSVGNSAWEQKHAQRIEHRPFWQLQTE